MSPESFRVLVFTKTAAYRHECIPAGIGMFKKLAAESQKTAGPFEVDASEDAEAVFTKESLEQYRVLVFFQCSGDILTADQLEVLKAFVSSGKHGVVGIHCASSAMKSRAIDPDAFYARLIGAVFTEHPAPQLGRVIIKDPKHPVVAPLLHALGPIEASVPEPSYSCFDEWYNFEPTASAAVQVARATAGPRRPSKDDGTDSMIPAAHVPDTKERIHILLAADETTYEGGALGEDHPIAWWQDFEGTGTRVFYTALGHFASSYEGEDGGDFVAHIREAVLWAAKVV